MTKYRTTNTTRRNRTNTRNRTNMRNRTTMTTRRNTSLCEKRSCNIGYIISSILNKVKKTFTRKRTRTPSKSTFPYHVVLVTTHGHDNCSHEDIINDRISKVKLPRNFQGGQIIRTGPIGDLNYLSHNFAEKIKNSLRIAVEQNRNNVTSVNSNLFQDVVKESDKGETRTTYFKKRNEYPIFEINDTLPERYYSIINNTLKPGVFSFNDSVLLLSENKTIHLMKEITGKSNQERIIEYKKDNDKNIIVTSFTLSDILHVLNERNKLKNHTKKVIIIDYGCSANISDRDARRVGRSIYSKNKYKRKKNKSKTVNFFKNKSAWPEPHFGHF